MVKNIIKSRMFIILGLLAFGAVFLSGCVQEKAPVNPAETDINSPAVTPGMPPQKPATVLVAATDPSFKWSNQCVLQKNPGASDGAWIACPDEGKPPAIGATINVTFLGNSVSLIHLKCPYCGIANVEIDGKTYQGIDTYSKEIAKDKTKIAEGLSNSQHTLKIVISDKKNQNSSSNLLVIDAIEITKIQ